MGFWYDIRKGLTHLFRSADEDQSVHGTIRVEVHDANGNLIPEESSFNPNIVVTVGKAALAQLIVGVTPSTSFQIGVGDGNTAPVAGNSDLNNRVYRANVTSKTSSSNQAIFKLYLGTGEANGYTLKEAGLFWNNILIDHALFASTVAKDATKTVTVTITLTLS